MPPIIPIRAGILPVTFPRAAAGAATFAGIASLCVGLTCALSGTAAAGMVISSPFKLIDNRVFIPATLDGHRACSLLLDTGADGWTVSDKLAYDLALAQGEAERIQGVGESEDTVHRMTLRSVELAGLSFVDQPALSEDFSALDEVIGFQHFDGIAGKPVFARRVVALDFAKSRVRFFRPADYSVAAGGKVIPFALYDATIPVVQGEINGVRGRFVVDLGDRSSLTLFGPFWRAHHLDRAFAPGLVALTGYGVGGPVKGELVRVPDFGMADVHVRGVIARLSLQKAGLFGDTAIAGSIGTGILKRFNVTFDYPGHRLILYRDLARDIPDTADRSGLWLGRNGKQLEVYDVIAKSPADQQGIRPGDLITAVDGTPAERLDLFAVRQELQSPARRSISMTVERRSRSRSVTITLEDLLPN